MKFTDYDKKTLKHLQNLELMILKDFVKICDENNLNYYIYGGSLLGAVRHEGFIPWDDDLDIIMIRKDYNKLINILPKEISKYPYFKENCGLTRLINMDENYFKDFNSIYDYGHGDYFIESGLSKSLFLQLGWIKPLIKLDIFPYDYINKESIPYYSKNYLGHKYYFRRLYSEKDFNFEEEFKKRFEKLGYSENETEYIAEGIDSSYFDDFGVLNKNLILE